MTRWGLTTGRRNQMGKITSVRLLKPGIDPLPSGPTVFSRHASLPPMKRSQSDTGEPSQASAEDPMQAGIDAMEAELKSALKGKGGVSGQSSETP